MTGLTRTRWNQHIHAAAGVVADGLLQDYQAGNTPIPAVERTGPVPLRVHVIADPVYWTRPAGMGGP